MLQAVWYADSYGYFVAGKDHHPPSPTPVRNSHALHFHAAVGDILMKRKGTDTLGQGDNLRANGRGHAITTIGLEELTTRPGTAWRRLADNRRACTFRG